MNREFCTDIIIIIFYLIQQELHEIDSLITTHYVTKDFPSLPVDLMKRGDKYVKTCSMKEMRIYFMREIAEWVFFESVCWYFVRLFGFYVSIIYFLRLFLLYFRKLVRHAYHSLLSLDNISVAIQWIDHSVVTTTEGVFNEEHSSDHILCGTNKATNVVVR